MNTIPEDVVITLLKEMKDLHMGSDCTEMLLGYTVHDWMDSLYSLVMENEFREHAVEVMLIELLPEGEEDTKRLKNDLIQRCVHEALHVIMNLTFYCLASGVKVQYSGEEEEEDA